MNWLFLVLGVVFTIPPLWTWQKIKAKEPTKMTRKAFFFCGGFVKLSEAARNEVASHANGLIGRSVVTAGVDYSPEQGREGIYMNFRNGPQSLGRSRFTDHTSIKWNKRYFN